MHRLLHLLSLLGDAERHARGKADQRAEVLCGLVCFDPPAEFFLILRLIVEDLTGVHERLGSLTERAEREVVFKYVL